MAEAVESKPPFYLRDLHAPVEGEIEAFDLEVEGTLPPELDGLYLRNGPNPAHGDPGHWFLGDGMLHGVTLEGGRAHRYRNRWVRTRALAGEARYVSDDGTVDFTAGVANTHVIGHAGRILALVENSFPWEVDRDLETIGFHDFDGQLEGAMTAHPKICPETGEMHFFGYHFAPPFLRYHRVDAKGALVESRTIEIPRPVMMHDFAITRDFVIFMDLPVCFSADSLMSGGMPYRWDDDAGARLGFLRRDTPGAEIDWVEIEPCYVFHPMNAFSQGNAITLDVARYDSLWRDTSERFDIARLHRFEVDLDRRTVRETPLDDLGIEFPRVKEDLTGLRHRIGYALCTRTGEGITSTQGLVRYDLERGEREFFDGGDGYVPSETVFVPSASGGGEGDGWLLGYFHDRSRDRSELAVFDATRISVGPVARVILPQRVPLGFHGSWLPRAR